LYGQLGGGPELTFKRSDCFQNKGPGKTGECINPAPRLTQPNEQIWELWNRSYGCRVYRGMDGDPVGRDPSKVEALARGLEIPWNRKTVIALQLIEGFEFEELDRQMKEREKARKAKK
jgi:hypothetical protein